MKTASIRILAHIFTSALGLLFCFPIQAGYSNYPISSSLTANGIVRDIKSSGSNMYLAGDFTYIGFLTGGGAAIGIDNALIRTAFPTIDGSVYAVIPDMHGGFFIGGSFSYAGYESRQNIAHILSKGIVDHNFNIAANGAVNALALSPDASTLFIGGDFTSIAGSKRNRLASIEIETNSPTEWAPSVNNSVRTIAVSPDGSTVYAGGTFTKINSSTRNRIAAFNSVDGSLLSWDPNAGNIVNSIVTSQDGLLVYVGGQFTAISGQARKYLAAINMDGTVCTFNPSPNASVNQILLSHDGALLYFCGAFSTVAGAARKHIAVARTSDGGLAPWIPASSNAQVEDIALSPDGTYLYICGQFTTVSSVPRTYAAALQASDGSLTNWNPEFEKNVSTLAVSSDNSTVYAGGAFMLAGGAIRNRLAAINTTNHTLLNWNPSADNAVYNIEFSPNLLTIYAGGVFNQIGGEPRNYIAAINTSSGIPTAWNPNSNSTVRSIQVSSDGKTVYAGGFFTQIGGMQRNYIASLGSSTGTALAWNPVSDGYVYSIQLSPDDKCLYAGGLFKNIGEIAQTYLAAIDTSTGTAKSWVSPANGTVYTLDLSTNGNLLFAGGTFTSCCGQKRNKAAAILTSNGTANSWNPNVNSTVQRLFLSTNGQTIYAGGSFTSIGATNRYYAASLESSDAQISSWNPILNNACLSFGFSGDASILFAGGNFTKVSSQYCPYLAAFASGYYHLKVENGGGDGNYAHGTVVEINADIPPKGHYFYKWTGSTSHIADINSPSTKVTMPSSDISVTATYKAFTYSINFISGINGVISGKTSQTISYGASTSSVKAVPDIDYAFVKWTGEGFESTNNPLVIKNVSSNMEITAYFAPIGQTANLTVSANPPEGGITTPSGISQIMLNRPFVISALPENGYHFVNWTGKENAVVDNPNSSSTTVTISADSEISANFAITPAEALLTMNVLPASSGTTSPSGTNTVTTATPINISANANEGYYFYKWTNDNAGALIQNCLAPSTNVIVYGNSTITAVFIAIPDDTYTTYGKVYNLKAEDVPQIKDFAKAPQVYCQSDVDPATGKSVKTRPKVLTKVGKTSLTAVDIEWTGRIPLLNSKVWTGDKTLTTQDILTEEQPKPLDTTVYVSAVDSTGLKIKNEPTLIVLSERLPEIFGIFDANGRPISAALASQTIIIEGSFFGKTAPSAWLEYKDKNGNIKKLNLKIDKKAFAFPDYSGKTAKYCMDIYTGESGLTASMPSKWPNGWTHIGNHNIVIDNKICRATIVFSTIPD